MDPGYDPYGATYRNQSRFPGFGVNYLFLSPVEAVDDLGANVGVTRSISKSFNQAKDPARTIFYVTSMRGATPTSGQDKIGLNDTTRGSAWVNAPGMWPLRTQAPRILIYQTGTQCGADWCADSNSMTAGNQHATGYAYIEKVLGGNNVAFLDGHVRFMTDAQMAVGTDYLTATPNGENNQGGARITDKKKYLWDLDGDFYGLYGDRAGNGRGDGR